MNMGTAADRNVDVLVLAPGGRDAAVIASMLETDGLRSRIERSVADLIAGLDQAATAIVTEEALLNDDRAPLARWVAEQPPWSDFPFVLLTLRERAAASRTGHLVELLGNVTVLERPLPAVTLVSATRAALRARRRQRQSEAHLQQRERAEASLRELAATLEQRVGERTRQLSEANDRLTAEIIERERTEAALLRMQKIEAVGQMTGGVAHDFNNLLTAIIGNLDLLIRRTDEERLLRLMRNAMHAALRGASLITQMLAFSRRQRLAPQAVDINELVDGMGDMLTRTVGPTVTLEMRLEPALWPALVDPTQLEMVILNLAINSRDAMPNGGRLTIATAGIEQVPAELAGELAPRQYVMIVVRDSGTGMTPDILARAFDPFFTTKGPGKGTGLGLSQVYGVARQSGGSVRIESRPGLGTSVFIYLPRTDAAAKPFPVDAVRRADRSGQATILVVDDDDEVREPVILMLQELGYRVVAAESGARGLDALARTDTIDLLLVDVAMPGMNGVEFVRIARGLCPRAAVLFASGYADMGVFENDLRDEELIKKPYRMSELAERLGAVLEAQSPGNAGHPARPAAAVRPDGRSVRQSMSTNAMEPGE
jgi:signal transduction histidine kinase